MHMCICEYIYIYTHMHLLSCRILKLYAEDGNIITRKIVEAPLKGKASRGLLAALACWYAKAYILMYVVISILCMEPWQSEDRHRAELCFGLGARQPSIKNIYIYI